MEDLDNVHINFDTNGLWILNIALAVVMFGVALGISVNDFKSLFTQVIGGSRFFKEKGLYHRDISPQNIILSKNGKLTAKIVDPRIKANCATRIALRVTSGINSRVILDFFTQLKCQ